MKMVVDKSLNMPGLVSAVHLGDTQRLSQGMLEVVHNYWVWNIADLYYHFHFGCNM